MQEVDMYACIRTSKIFQTVASGGINTINDLFYNHKNGTYGDIFNVLSKYI